MNKNLKLVKSFYADETNLFSSLHRDVEWCETEGFPYGGTYRGVQALMDGVFSHIEKDWDGFRATPHTVLPSGADHVVTLGHYSGVFKKTGKTMKAAFAHVYTPRDGKVIRFQQFGDSALFRAAMGQTSIHFRVSWRQVARSGDRASRSASKDKEKPNAAHRTDPLPRGGPRSDSRKKVAETRHSLQCGS